jgi:TatD DNase family protein
VRDVRGVIDTHAHLAHKRFDRDRAEVLAKVWASGVERLLEVGYDRASSEAAVALAGTDPRIRAAVGIHPHGAGTATDDDRKRVNELATIHVVRAIGETGLDYYRNLSPRDQQQAEFRRQIGLARELRLPLVVHDRDAHEDVLHLLREERASEVGGVLHCFSGDGEMARAAHDLGFRVGLGGTVTYPAPGKDEMLAAIPLSQIVL